MVIPITYRVKMKEGLFVEVELWPSTATDTVALKRASSLLATVAQAIEGWQARHGNDGCPQPQVTREELHELAEERR